MAKENTAKKEAKKSIPQQPQVIQVVHSMNSNTEESSLDRLIHERVRLGIVSALAANESLTFNALKKLLNATDGNLSVHARKLEEAGYIICKKSFDGRTPKTEYRLAKKGRQALERYLNHMEALIQAMKAI